MIACNFAVLLITFRVFVLQSATRSNLQYGALSTLRRLPLDPDNPAYLHRAVQGYATS